MTNTEFAQMLKTTDYDTRHVYYATDWKRPFEFTPEQVKMLGRYNEWGVLPE